MSKKGTGKSSADVREEGRRKQAKHHRIAKQDARRAKAERRRKEEDRDT